MNGTMMIRDVKPRKFREEDQFFMVGPYNVNFYSDKYVGRNNDYYGLEIQKFEGNLEIKRTWMYVDASKHSYADMWSELHSEKKLDELINSKRGII